MSFDDREAGEIDVPDQVDDAAELDDADGPAGTDEVADSADAGDRGEPADADEPTDARDACGPGEGAELDWLGEPMRRRLVACALRFTRDRWEAEDIAQETLLRAAQSQRQLRTAERMEAWLFRICRHAAIDQVRSRNVRRGVWCGLPAGNDAPAGGGEADGPSAWDGGFDALPDAGGLAGGSIAEIGAPAEAAARVDLSSLPAPQRLLVALHYERGLSQATLCRMSGLSPSALRVRLFRARHALT